MRLPRASQEAMKREIWEKARERAALKTFSDKKLEIVLYDWLKQTTPKYNWDWPYIRHIQNALNQVTSGTVDKLILELPPRHGKALHVDTPIPTPDGWVRISDLKIGDKVFDESGNVCRVIAVSEVWKNRPVYRVITDDGDEIIADEEHEWPARLCGKFISFKNHTTKVIARKRAKRAMIKRQGALVLPEVALPIHPYVLGVWLGDGCSNHATITQSDEDINWMRQEIEKCGYLTSNRKTKATFGILGLQERLRSAGMLNNKHIPKLYLRASREQRLKLLQGLIDTDGYVSKEGQIEFCTVNEDLANGVSELVFSLGRKASISIGRALLNGKDYGKKYRVSFYMLNAAMMPRKALRCRESIRTFNRYVKAISCGVADTVCIQVDSPNNLFLCGRSMLPTHNSEITTIRYPVYRFERDPQMRVIVGAYNQTLANRFSRMSRKIAAQRISLSEERKAVEEWETAAGGTFRAVGVGGGATGQGADLIVIDDPIKNREEAESPTYRDKIWDWYTNDIYTRKEPGCAIIIIMTRWHKDDLVGRILDSDDAVNWRIICLPAEAEINDPLGRNVGEALCPDRFDEEALSGIKKVLGRDYQALYQQRPVAREGGMFKEHWFVKVDAVPREAKRIRAWDFASTEDGGDYTVGLLMAEKDGIYYVEDVVRGQWSSGSRDKIIRETALNDAAHYGDVTHWGEQEPGSGGKYQAAAFIKLLAGFNVYTEITSGAKPVLAMPFASQTEAGNVRVKRAHWTSAYIAEMCDFPQGAHDDQVDASAKAFAKLALNVDENDSSAVQYVRRSALEIYGDLP